MKDLFNWKMIVAVIVAFILYDLVVSKLVSKIGNNFDDSDNFDHFENDYQLKKVA